MNDFEKAAGHAFKFAVLMSPAALEKRLAVVGKRGAEIANAAVRSTPAAHGSLADGSMSNWRRGNPIQIVARGYKPRVSGDSGHMTVAPASRGAAGPMRVLESGRGARGVAQRVGYRKLKGGAVRVRQGKVLGASHALAGKGTWSRASRAMDRELPRLFTAQQAKALLDAFKG